MSDDALRWLGWVRRRKGARWEAVCQAPTIHQCARLLEIEARRRGVFSSANQMLVLGDAYPRERGGETV